MPYPTQPFRSLYLLCCTAVLFVGYIQILKVLFISYLSYFLKIIFLSFLFIEHSQIIEHSLTMKIFFLLPCPAGQPARSSGWQPRITRRWMEWDRGCDLTPAAGCTTPAARLAHSALRVVARACKSRSWPHGSGRGLPVFTLLHHGRSALRGRLRRTRMGVIHG